MVECCNLQLFHQNLTSSLSHNERLQCSGSITKYSENVATYTKRKKSFYNAYLYIITNMYLYNIYLV